MQDYLKLRDVGYKLGDDGFCTILSTATITGLSFQRCRRKLEKYGRKRGEGAYTWVQLKALKAFGYSSKSMYQKTTTMSHQFPYRAISKGLTANQFSEKYNKGVYLVRIASSNMCHVACLVDGVYNDWIDKKYRGKAPKFLVDEAFLITKLET